MPSLKLPVHLDQPLTITGAAPGLAAFLAPPNDPEMVARLGQEKVLLHQTDCMVLEGERYGTRTGGAVVGRRYLALSPSHQGAIGVLNVTVQKNGRKTLAIASNVFVDPEHRRQGIASSLVKLALKDFPGLVVDNNMTSDGAKLFGKEEAPATVPVLVIVHPGSACGSAEMNLGRDCADYQRLEMQGVVENWNGAVVVIDGHLSDELDGFRGSWKNWGDTITQALNRSREQGLLGIRVMGDDSESYNQQEAIRDVIRAHGLTPENTTFTLTGAWVEEDGGGCVHSVREVLEEQGFSTVLDSPMDLDFSLDNDDELDSDEELDCAPASRRPRMG